MRVCARMMDKLNYHLFSPNMHVLELFFLASASNVAIHTHSARCI